MGVLDKLKNKLRDYIGENKGVAGDDYQGGIRDPKPYKYYDSSGLFLGYDDRLWMYFKMPDDVQTRWTQNPNDIAENQAFLVNIFDALGKSIYNDSQSTRKDQRIRFHIPMVREVATDIEGFDDATPALKDFYSRMNIAGSPKWHSYFGVELLTGDINSDIVGLDNKVRNYIDFMTGKLDVQFNLYKEFIELVNGVCLDNRMKPLDFKSNPEDFERLTAWYGEPDFKYSQQRELTQTLTHAPGHGKSIFAGEYEYTFSAISPRESNDMFATDPIDPNSSQFGNALLVPEFNVCHINIRGEIRSSETAAAIFDDRATRNLYKGQNKNQDNSSMAEINRISEQSEKAKVANETAAGMGHAWLDNVEMTVAQRIHDKMRNNTTLNEMLGWYNMRATNLTLRQLPALHSTIATYPNPIFRIPSDNKKRNPHVNNFFSGVLGMSGLFRSIKPAGPGGILLGLSSSGFEFREIYTELDAPKKYNASPTMMITGSTGSGKALSLDTKLPTPCGWTTMGDVHVGDDLLGPDGNPTKVVFETEIQYDRPVVEMIFNNKTSVKSDYNHQWIIKNIWGYDHSDISRKLRNILKKENDRKVSIEELYESVHGISEFWSSTKSLEASLNFVDFDIKKDMSLHDAIQALNTRSQQRISAKSWSADAIRFTTLEIIELVNSGDFSYSDFAIIPAEMSTVGAHYENDADHIGYTQVVENDISNDTTPNIGNCHHFSYKYIKSWVNGAEKALKEGHPISQEMKECLDKALSCINSHYDENDKKVYKDDYYYIHSIKDIESVPVKCIQVDNPYSAYLVEDYIPTSNTVQMLMMAAQVAYSGKQVIFLNPKPNSTLAPFFEHLDGHTINMSREYLTENPGLLDPMFYLSDREQVGEVLTDMIISAQRMETDRSLDMARSVEELKSQLIERAKMPANRCSFDIIFGNKSEGVNTPALEDMETMDFVRNKMNNSPFWKASISTDPNGRGVFKEMFDSRKPLLIEWDKNIILPAEGKNEQSWSSNEQDGIQSIINLFKYASDIIGRGKEGGMLIIDEAHYIRSSEVAMGLIKTAGRTWRSSNITLMLGTQNLDDFAGGDDNDISSYVRTFIIMNISEQDEKEQDHFFRITQLEKDEDKVQFITNMGIKDRKSGKSPSAYIVDRAYPWSGPIICGPWPATELAAAANDLSVSDILDNRQRANIMDDQDNEVSDMMSQIREDEANTREI